MSDRQFPTSLKALFLLVCLTVSGFSQSAKAPAGAEALLQRDLVLEKALLLNELQSLEKETIRFDDPSAEALAKAEIADAAWPLDEVWAKELLRAAYALVLPKADRTEELKKPAGSRAPLPDATTRSRLKVRLRVLNVARRDRAFADELLRSEAENFGAYGEHFASAALADQAMMEGDVNVAADYALRGIKADPTQGAAPDIINRIAMRDRAEADRLALLYIDELRRFPLNSANQSDLRVFLSLSLLVGPHLSHDPNITKPIPGPAVMRAYVAFMLEALTALEQREPGYLRLRRRMLLNLWPTLQRYAPELAPAFMNLEGRGRGPGQNLSLPTAAGIEEERRSRHEQSMRDALGGDRPGEGVIYSAISRGDFDGARRLIAKLPDGASKRQLNEAANAEEAANFAAGGI
jgi:hypothetical protein